MRKLVVFLLVSLISLQTVCSAQAETLADKLGLVSTHDKLVQAKCLAQNIYYEARGETVEGQLAVAQVTINRVLSGHFEPTICGVVWQGANRKTGCQFSWTCRLAVKLITEPKEWDQAQTIAWTILKARFGYLPVGDATYYHAKNCHPSWVADMVKVISIGVHIFYEPRRM